MSNQSLTVPYFISPRRRIYCERLIDGKWTAVKNNGEIAYRDEDLDTFNDSYTNEIYNISIVWATCQSDILGEELKEILAGETVTTLRFSELNLFIDKSVEGMYSAVTLEAIRNTQMEQEDCLSREAFDSALNSYAELKAIERDVRDILGERPEYIDYSDIRIIWAKQ